MASELMPKRLELLSELVPQARVIALLVNPNNANTERVIRDVQEAAHAKGVQLDILKAGTEGEIDAAFTSLVQLQAGALVVGSDVFFNSRREQLVALAARHAVPAIYDWREFAAAGGLISYGSSLTAHYRQVGIYAGKILKGAKPADLPVAAADYLRAGRQPQDRQGARPDDPALDPRPRRRGYRVRCVAAALAIWSSDRGSGFGAGSAGAAGHRRAADRYAIHRRTFRRVVPRCIGGARRC